MGKLCIFCTWCMYTVSNLCCRLWDDLVKLLARAMHSIVDGLIRNT